MQIRKSFITRFIDKYVNKALVNGGSQLWLVLETKECFLVSLQKYVNPNFISDGVNFICRHCSQYNRVRADHWKYEALLHRYAYWPLLAAGKKLDACYWWRWPFQGCPTSLPRICDIMTPKLSFLFNQKCQERICRDIWKTYLETLARTDSSGRCRWICILYAHCTLWCDVALTDLPCDRFEFLIPN